MSVSEKNAPTPISSFASTFTGSGPRVPVRARPDPCSQLMSLVLGYVVDRDVLRVVVVPDRPFRPNWWQPLEVVVRRRRMGEPLECARVPGVVPGLHDV